MSIWKDSSRTKMSTNLSNSKGDNLSLMVCHEIVIAHDVTHSVHTLQTSSLILFKAMSFLALIHKGSSSWIMFHFT
jgi:hypothetical protein